MKYLIHWKVEHDIYMRENLENVKEVIVEFERSLSVEIRRQEKLDIVEEKSFRREELLEKYIKKILYK